MVFIRYLAATAILILIGQTPLTDPLRSTAAAIGNPVQYGAYHLGQNLRSIFYFYTNLSKLDRENTRLREKIIELDSRLTALAETERENELLREQLNLPDTVNLGQLVLAEVVGRSQSGGHSRLIIDKGSAVGVTPGAAVVIKNILLGEVVEVSKKRSTVRLLTDPEFSAAVLDQDSPNRAKGLATGRYGTGIVFSKVLPHEEIAVGDTIITSGEDGKFVRGLILGQVESISGADTAVFKSSNMHSPVDFLLLEQVFVLK